MPRLRSNDPWAISVVIVNWNSKADLASCLRSLRCQTDDNFEVIVVDNGSTDGSVDMVEGQYPEVRLVATGGNLGFAEGCNRGIQVARGAWIAALNNDAEADEQWIGALRKAAQAGEPSLGMIQSCILFKQRTGYTNSTGVKMLPNGKAIDRDYDAPLREDRELRDVFCASAGAALYRRTMLDATRLPSGYFDRTFFMYYEDVDLGWRCRLAGWDATYSPNAIVYHAFHASSARRGNHFVYLHCYKNRIRYLIKNGSVQLLIRSLPVHLFGLPRAIRGRGLALVPDLATAIVDGMRQRASVGDMSRLNRRDLEKRWFLDNQCPTSQ